MLRLKYAKIKENLLKFLSDTKVKNNLSFNVFSALDSINNKIIESKVKLLRHYIISEDVALSLLDKMPEMFLYSDDEINKHLSFIYNSNSLYAVLFCLENEYIWINYNEKTRSFREKKSIVFDLKNIDMIEDSIIRNIINATYRGDIVKSAQIEQNDSLEERIFKLKQLKINSSGYRIL